MAPVGAPAFPADSSPALKPKISFQISATTSSALRTLPSRIRTLPLIATSALSSPIDAEIFLKIESRPNSKPPTQCQSPHVLMTQLANRDDCVCGEPLRQLLLPKQHLVAHQCYFLVIRLEIAINNCTLVLRRLICHCNAAHSVIDGT